MTIMDSNNTTTNNTYRDKRLNSDSLYRSVGKEMIQQHLIPCIVDTYVRMIAISINSSMFLGL